MAMPLNPTRRVALGALAGLGALSIAAADEALSAPSFSLYGMKDVPLDKALDHLKSTGYGGVELVCLPGWDTDPMRLTAGQVKGIRESLASRNMIPVGLMLDLPLDIAEETFVRNLALLARACAMARQLNEKAPPILETVLGGKPGDLPKRLNVHLDRLGRVETVLAKEGGTLALKPHRMQAFDDAKALAGLISQSKSPRVVAAFDPSHFQHRMPGIAESWKVLGPLTHFIHVKETVINNRQLQFVLPGEGGLDLKALRALFVESRYRGPICVEVSRQVWSVPGYDPFLAATRAFPAMRTITHG